MACLCSVVTPFHLSTQVTLTDFQAALAAVKVLWFDTLLPRAEGSEGCQAQVEADLGQLWLAVVNLYLALNGNEVLTALGFRDGAILHHTFNWTMEDDFAPTNLGRYTCRPLTLNRYG